MKVLVSNNNPSSLLLLLEPDSYGFIAATRRREPVLLTAASCGYFHSANLLLNAWANPNIPGNDGRTALHLAVRARSPVTVSLLITKRMCMLETVTAKCRYMSRPSMKRSPS